MLGKITGPAVARLIDHPNPTLAPKLFSDREKEQLADALAATNATADLLARSRVRERQDKAEANAGAKPFAEDLEPSFARFADPVPLLAPDAALHYFLGLVPKIGVDPKRFGQDHARDAFTLADVTETTLLERIQKLIGEALQTGREIRDRPKQIERLLHDAGVHPRNAGYAEMVFRTNAQDAYNTGAMREMQDPEVINTFPVWKYLGIADGRQGRDHEPHFDKYFPTTTSFNEVRDSLVVKHGQVVKAGPGEGRPFSCRCTPQPVSRWDWERLQKQGAALSTFAESFANEYHGLVPPGPGWVLAGQGSRGGKIWKRKEQTEAAKLEESKAPAIAAPPAAAPVPAPQPQAKLLKPGLEDKAVTGQDSPTRFAEDMQALIDEYGLTESEAADVQDLLANVAEFGLSGAEAARLLALYRDRSGQQ